MNKIYSVLSAGFCKGMRAHEFSVEEKVFTLPEGPFSMPVRRKLNVYQCGCGCRRIGTSLWNSVIYK